MLHRASALPDARNLLDMRISSKCPFRMAVGPGCARTGRWRSLSHPNVLSLLVGRGRRARSGADISFKWPRPKVHGTKPLRVRLSWPTHLFFPSLAAGSALALEVHHASAVASSEIVLRDASSALEDIASDLEGFVVPPLHILATA